jgi:hypothetical protein
MFIIEFGRSFFHTNKVEVDTCSIEVDAQGSRLAASPRPGFTEQRCNDTIRRKLERRAGGVPVDRHSIPLADVAQLVEQLIRNQQVIGSSPIVGSIENPSLISTQGTAAYLPSLHNLRSQLSCSIT